MTSLIYSTEDGYDALDIVERIQSKLAAGYVLTALESEVQGGEVVYTLSFEAAPVKEEVPERRFH